MLMYLEVYTYTCISMSKYSCYRLIVSIAICSCTHKTSSFDTPYKNVIAPDKLQALGKDKASALKMRNEFHNNAIYGGTINKMAAKRQAATGFPWLDDT